MTPFDRREQAFAGLKGKTGPESQAYVDEIVASTGAKKGDDAPFQRVKADFGNRVDDADLRDRTAGPMSEALAHVKTA